MNFFQTFNNNRPSSLLVYVNNRSSAYIRILFTTTLFLVNLASINFRDFKKNIVKFNTRENENVIKLYNLTPVILGKNDTFLS